MIHGSFQRTWLPGCSLWTRVLLFLAVGLGIWSIGGCTPNPPTANRELTGKLLLKESPAEINSLKGSYTAFQPDAEIVAAGRIFADNVSPFALETASFSLIEMPKPGHDHENPGDCPFCKREMQNAATAIVEMIDENGETIRGSAEAILGLKKNQDVVVVGKATMVGDVLLIRARALHVLEPAHASELAKRFSS